MPDLIEATTSGNLNAVIKVLNEEADINTTNEYNNNTPLHLAALFNYKDIATLLLALGANVNATNRINNTPLHLASRNGRKEIAEILLANGADVNIKNNRNLTAAQLAYQNGHQDIVKMLTS